MWIRVKYYCTEIQGFGNPDREKMDKYGFLYNEHFLSEIQALNLVR